ncbi:glycosyltransferase family 4 protein [Aquipuribacter sp. MA13-6]|uniref:glycosyltransferase family 4 protein n=1 Tax=unclassified Aquipuribacter TaxID=2635084 RepID=UPI003EEB5185
MRTTILIGPTDRRSRGVAAFMLAEAAALRSRLRARGADVRLVSAFDPGVTAADGDDHLRPDVVLDVPVRVRDQRADGIASAGLLARELARVAADGIVHAVGWRATAVAVTARGETGTPVVAHVDQLPSFPGDDRADGTVMARLGWAALAAADHVVVESTWARDVAVRRGVLPDRLHAVGPALTRLPQGEAPRSPSGEDPLVLSVGDPGDVGSLRPVAEAVLHHAGARLLVARSTGMDETAAAAVKERLRELPVVRRLGTRCKVALAPASTLCATADLVVDVSSTPGRGLGVLAAMFEARPLVAAAVGGADELVVDRVTGLLVEPRDRVHTRDGVAALLQDPFRLEAYGLAGRDRAHAVFDPELLADATSRVHDRARGRLGEPSGGEAVDPADVVDVRHAGAVAPAVHA